MNDLEPVARTVRRRPSWALADNEERCGCGAWATHYGMTEWPDGQLSASKMGCGPCMYRWANR